MKEDIVNEQVQKIQDGELEVLKQGLGEAFEAGKLEGGGGISQEQLDAAVAQGKADQKVEDDALQVEAIAKALADDAVLDLAEVEAIRAEAQAKMDELSAKLDALNVELADAGVKLAADSVIIDGLKGAKESIQAALDALKALILG